MGRADVVTSEIRKHDPKLFCRSREGKLCIYRESTRVETYYLDDNVILHSVRSAPHFVMALTDSWKFDGEAVDWGLEPILARLRDMDLWNRDLVSEMEKKHDEHEQKKLRELRNNSEDFLYEFRDKFKETFKDVNVSTVHKKDRRTLEDKKVKGN